MATISTSDFKNGMSIELSDGLFQIQEFQHVKPGKGGAFVRSTLKNLRTGAVVDRTFRAGEKVENAFIEKREQQFLYRDSTDYVVMDNETFEQQNVPEAVMGEAGNFLTDGMNIVLMMYGTEIVGTDLPAAVELEVVETEPGLQGDRVSGARKPATLETGLVIQVPLFVEVGGRVKVDTRSGEYLTRV
ncbi:MAG: elongation factor P [Actinomycetota bacterium]